MIDFIKDLNGEYYGALKTMGGSGIEWIDVIFRYCVVLLVEMAKYLGISYEELNIWLFIIILPGLLLLSFVLNIYLIKKLKRNQRLSL